MNTPSQSAQTEQNQTTDHTIKFHHAENGEINTRNGQTVFSDLFIIGAFSLTSQLKSDGKDVWREYATDFSGLKELESKIGEDIDIIADAITTLGVMMAYVNRSELGDTHFDNYAWLVAGLGELLGQLAHENSEISHTLSTLTKQAYFDGVRAKDKASPANPGDE